jgi:hypothetical protein
MSGKVMRISQKGFVFKTYEGKINLESFGALRGASPIQEVFDFSVEKSNQEVINTLKDVSLTGERVNLHYVKRYAKFFWRGDTQYFVTSVTRKNTENSTCNRIDLYGFGNIPFSINYLCPTL